MKRNVGKYENVSKLPAKAMTVKDYADKKNMTIQNVYNILSRKGELAGFKIVTFNTFNFVIEED
jgi:hypothetical protein